MGPRAAFRGAFRGKRRVGAGIAAAVLLIFGAPPVAAQGPRPPVPAVVAQSDIVRIVPPEPVAPPPTQPPPTPAVTAPPARPPVPPPPARPPPQTETTEPPDPTGATYGAIAYSPATGAHGWANNHTSRSAAEGQALAYCRQYAKDCIEPVWFRNACGALAVGPNGYGMAWGADRRAAEAKAMQTCRKYSGNCGVRRWVCTGQ